MRAGYVSASIEGRIAVEFFDPSLEAQARKYAFKCHRQVVDGVDHVFPVNAIAFHPMYVYILVNLQRLNHGFSRTKCRHKPKELTYLLYLDTEPSRQAVVTGLLAFGTVEPRNVFGSIPAAPQESAA